jgi:hypothetical protein
MHRVTRPGGRLLLTTPNYANFMGLYEIYSLFRHPAHKDDQPFDRRQWFPQILKWVRQAGWKIPPNGRRGAPISFAPGPQPNTMESAGPEARDTETAEPAGLHVFCDGTEKREYKR